MQDASFAETATAIRTASVAPSTRLAMVLLGYIPLLHLASVVAPFFLPLPLWTRVATALGALYIVPPLLARIAAIREGSFAPSERGFLRWWFTNQLQVLFNRLPLEEIIRIVPGLYNVWLRLWGSEIGSFVYWSPRVLPLDRGLLRIGKRVVIGAGVRLTGHVLTKRPDGGLVLTVGRVTVGDDALIGGWALLAPGVTVSAGESVPPAIGMPPQTTWSGGRRRRTKDHAV